MTASLGRNGAGPMLPPSPGEQGSVITGSLRAVLRAEGQEATGQPVASVFVAGRLLFERAGEPLPGGGRDA